MPEPALSTDGKIGHQEPGLVLPYGIRLAKLTESQSHTIGVLYVQSVAPALYKKARRLGMCVADAEDAVGEYSRLFLRDWHYFDPSKWPGQSVVTYWLTMGSKYLRRLARRRAIVHERLHVFGLKHDVEDHRETSPTSDSKFDSKPCKNLATEALLSREMEFILRSTPVKDREVLTLLFLNELTTQQVADQLGISTAAVRQRKKRAIDRLRMRLHNKSASTFPAP